VTLKTNNQHEKKAYCFDLNNGFVLTILRVEHIFPTDYLLPKIACCN